MTKAPVLVAVQLGFLKALTTQISMFGKGSGMGVQEAKP